MIGFAPMPINDELLYSYLSRWFFLSGVLSDQVFLKTIAGRVFDASASALGCQINFNCKDSLLKNKEWISENFTLLPFSRPFLRIDKSFEESDSFGKNSVERPLFNNIWARRFGHQSELRCCSICVSDQNKKYHCGVWLRSHNLPGVRACTTHGILLQAYPLLRTYSYKEAKLILVPKHAANVEVIKANSSMLWYANMAKDLLNSGLPNIDATYIRDELQKSLRERFDINTDAQVNSILRCNIGKHFHHSFLKAIEFDRSMPICRGLFDSHIGYIDPVHLILISRFSHNNGIIELLKNALESHLRSKKSTCC
ncbi:TniQ family protein [Rhodoferax sp. U2-2l]|uniref:TniQ family protein n=1 Tax=Rhodoferax sp. U2-2l TaxID=2884000 RepID=UPI001D0BAEBF|nr:TniQ family protein [Rhodoferax sp. U2-2l]MCB8749030.1 TniQ family protein [Rhodoferax sp. U2-2l]